MSRARPAVFITLLLASAALVLLGGCGGSDDSGVSQADTDQLTALAKQINEVSKQRDAAGFCAILSPGEIKSTFRSRAVCTRQYRKIFATIKNPGTATLENIAVDGDTAEVTFKEQESPVRFVRENGRWWLALQQQPESGSATGPSGIDQGVTG